MDKPSIIMEICSKYKEFIENNLDYVLCIDNDKKLQSLGQKYNIESSNLYGLKNQLKEIISQKIQDIVINDIKDNIVQEENNDKSNDNEIGESIISSDFLTIIKQLYLEKRLYKEALEPHINIIETLWAYLGNSYRYEVENTNWDMLFQYAMELSFLDSRFRSILREDLDIIIKATKLLIEHDSEFQIFEGEVILTDGSHKRIHSMLEKMIGNVGGMNILADLFKYELDPKYNSELNRYLIHRNKSTTGMSVKKQRVPYNYLINLCGKHLNEGVHIFSSVGRQKYFEDILLLSSSYLSILNIQGYSVFGDANIRYMDIPKYISDNIVFENLYIPIQYNPDIILEILDNLYRDLFQKSGFKEFSFNEYYKLATILLQKYGYCSKISINELISKTKIKKTTIIKILNEISISKDYVNNDFTEILTYTNLFDKPLVSLGNNEYFLISPHFCGYSFITIIHEILERLKVSRLNRQLGEILEEYIKSKLDDKGFRYYSGHYFEGSKTEGECDIVLETNKKIVFIEVKKRGLSETFKLGDDVDVLNSLSEGMINAQKQTLKHKTFIQNKGFMKLHEEQNTLSPCSILNWDDKIIISISLCLPEYGFFTNKLISEKLLESLRFVSYHSVDPSKEQKLAKLNGFRNDVERLVGELEVDNKETDPIFFDSLFRSLQQFLYALDLSETIEDLVDYLTSEIHIIYGSLDFYTNLLNKI